MADILSIIAADARRPLVLTRDDIEFISDALDNLSILCPDRGSLDYKATSGDHFALEWRINDISQESEWVVVIPTA